MKKHLVIIEATTSGAGLRVIDSAHRLGLEVSFFTADPNKYQRFNQTGTLDRLSRIVVVNTSDCEQVQAKVEQLNESHPVDGLVCMTDGNIEMAAQVATHMGLPFLSPDAVSLARNKDRTRELCGERGIRIPRFQVVSNMDTALDLAAEWGYPCILKSSRGTGSAQVILCRDESELRSAYPVLDEKARAASGQLLLEEFLRGPLYSVEAITYEGTTHILGITDRLLGNLPYFVEVSYSFPIMFDEQTERAIYEMVTDLLQAMGVNCGATHTELILTADGPAIVEVNPRLGGGMIGPMISESYGFDIYEQLIRIAFNEAPQIPEHPVGGAATYVVYATTEGVIERVHDQIARTYPGVKDIVINAKQGDLVKPPEDFRGDIGYVWATGNTVDMAASNCRAAVSAIWMDVK